MIANEYPLPGGWVIEAHYDDPYVFSFSSCLPWFTLSGPVTVDEANKLMQHPERGYPNFEYGYPQIVPSRSVVRASGIRVTWEEAEELFRGGVHPRDILFVPECGYRIRAVPVTLA